MSHLLEVLVTADCNNTLWTCSVWDHHTGTTLTTYRGGGTTAPRTVNFIGNDYLAAAEQAKPILHIWPLNSQTTVQGQRFILPGKTKALSVSADGYYLVCGVEEKMYVWQLSSGRLLTIIARHYQEVTMVKFTPDGKFFVSGAQDGMVMVWSLATVSAHPEIELVTQSYAGQHDPVHMFSDHTLPVTDIYISKMGMHDRMATVSTDRTCKIYELSTGEMLLNIVFNTPLLSVTMDVLELTVFVGTSEGPIHSFSLMNPPRNKEQYLNSMDLSNPFAGHSKGVTCLSTSLDGETLLSGGNDEQVILWHIPSHQQVRTIRHKGPITNAFFTLNKSSIYKQDFSPNVTLHNLDRTLERENDNPAVIEVYTKDEIAFWPPIECSSESSNVHNQDLLQEIENLKKINAELYKFSINKVLSAVEQQPTINSITNNVKPSVRKSVPAKKKRKIKRTFSMN